ncbi:hypothetical protein UT300018_25260 [Clostridium faecium]
MENHNIKLFDQISSQWRKNIPKKTILLLRKLLKVYISQKTNPFWMLDAVQVFYIL